MPQSSPHTEQIKQLYYTFFQKGYQGRCELKSHMPSQPRQYGSLKECLERFVQNVENHQTHFAKFSILTKVTNLNSVRDHQVCFDGQYDEIKGISFYQMVIQSGDGGPPITRMIIDPRGIPGYHAVTGMFPKKMPWDDIIKRKYPGRRR